MAESPPVADKNITEGEESTKVENNPLGKLQKRTLTEMKGGVSEEELEVYKRSRAAADDPMAKFLGKDELVH